jgi:hypothetical protein
MRHDRFYFRTAFPDCGRARTAGKKIAKIIDEFAIRLTLD